MNVTILSGVTVGHGAILAANATVVSDVGPYEIWGGNPARLIRKRFEDEVRDELLALAWWDLPEAQIREIAPLLSGEPTAAALKELRARVGR